MRSVEDAQAVLDAGADKVSVNSAAVARPELLSELAEVFGAQCTVLAIDARREPEGSYAVYVNGGRTAGRARRDRVGPRGRGARRGGDPAHEHGPRRHRGRLRAHADPRGCRRGGRAGDRLGRRRHARPPRGRGGEGRGRRRPVRLDLPLRSRTRCARRRNGCATRGFLSASSGGRAAVAQVPFAVRGEQLEAVREHAVPAGAAVHFLAHPSRVLSMSLPAPPKMLSRAPPGQRLSRPGPPLTSSGPGPACRLSPPPPRRGSRRPVRPAGGRWSSSR